MRESSVIQHFLRQGIEQGVQQGSRESIIEGILESLEVRFGVSDLSGIAAALVGIEDLGRLKPLRREAMVVPSLSSFSQTLGLTETESQNGSN